MAQKRIREYHAKEMFNRFVKQADTRLLVTPKDSLQKLLPRHPWLKKTPLVVKPDQLIKRRGKNDLILLNANWQQATDWITKKRDQPVTLDGITDTLEYFLIEPFVEHKEDQEYYLSMNTTRQGDVILFYHQGGVDVGQVEQKAEKLLIPLSDTDLTKAQANKLAKNVASKQREAVADFLVQVYDFFVQSQAAFLEMNPFIITKEGAKALDIAMKLDDTASQTARDLWGSDIEFPVAFGQRLSPEEQYISDLDHKTGASLKLTILNPQGRIWTMVAGGGSSVIYADTISDLGAGLELANYGEYSGNPNQRFTYEYAKTVLQLMLKKPHPRGSILIIGGGIANFTDVAQTFTGIIQALEEFKKPLKKHGVKIYVRRGGPNWQTGLQNMKNLGQKIDLPIEVFGPETHMTRIVSMALKKPLTK